MKKLFIYSISFIIFLNLLLLISSKSFLISEKEIKQGTTTDSKIIYLPDSMQYYNCKYWTGRSIIKVQFYTSAVAQCPFIYDL